MNEGRPMHRRWATRPVASDLVARYEAEGFWTGGTLGDTLHKALLGQTDTHIRVWSDARPFHGPVAEVYDRARRAATSLRDLGVRPGDVVAMQLPNWVEAAVSFWAASLAGAVILPVVHAYGPRELGYILRQSGARVHVTAGRFGSRDYVESLATVRGDLPDLEHVFVVGSSFEDLCQAAPIDGPVPVDPTMPAFLNFTSGTTADPKGVIHTHRTVLGELHQRYHPGVPPESRQLEPPSSARRTLVASPVGHVAGMTRAFLTSAVLNLSVDMVDRWDPERILQIIVEADLSVGGGAAYFLSSLLERPDLTGEHLERMRYVSIGGSPVPRSLAERASECGITLVRSYGSTEHPSISGSAYDDPEAKRVFTDGRLFPGVDLRIVDAGGRVCSTGEAGEIQTRGPDLFEGYTDPRLNAGAFTADGWFRTGDLGVMDADGYLSIVGRLKDVIIRGGENISAREVEEVLASMPAVREVACVAAPDERMGERVCVFIEIAVDATVPSLEDMREYLAGTGLARQKWPEELRIIDQFERTASGKIKKTSLHELVAAPAGA